MKNRKRFHLVLKPYIVAILTALQLAALQSDHTSGKWRLCQVRSLPQVDAEHAHQRPPSLYCHTNLYRTHASFKRSMCQPFFIYMITASGVSALEWYIMPQGAAQIIQRQLLPTQGKCGAMISHSSMQQYLPSMTGMEWSDQVYTKVTFHYN